MTLGREGGSVSRETATAGEMLADILGEFREVACEQCGRPFHVRGQATQRACERCEQEGAERDRNESEAARVFGNLDFYLDDWLKRAGLSRREITARWDAVPANILARLESAPLAETVAEMCAGRLPARGFGFSGPNGCGKTFALVSVVRRMLEAKLRADMPKRGLEALKAPWLSWVSWPEFVNRIRVRSTVDGGLEEVSHMIESLVEVPVLVLDELGAERMRSTYDEDWAVSQLDAIVDGRYNDMRPTWWTTNLDGGAMMARYGGRMFSRLVHENPPARVTGVPDIRAKR